jgi:hypothetical protein
MLLRFTGLMQFMWIADHSRGIRSCVLDNAYGAVPKCNIETQNGASACDRKDRRDGVDKVRKQDVERSVRVWQ